MELMLFITLVIAPVSAAVNWQYRPWVGQGMMMMFAASLATLPWLFAGAYGLSQPTCMERSPHPVCDGLEGRSVIIVLTAAFMVFAFLYGLLAAYLTLRFRKRK